MTIAHMTFALILSFALSAAAQAAPIALAEVEIGEDLAEKVEDYGQRDIERLVEDLAETVSERLTRDGHVVGDAGEIRIVITLENAWPNRPTRQQLGDRPGLSIQSLYRGGADVSGVLFDASGEQIAEIDYRWRTLQVTESIGRATWTDAERTFDRFARNLAEELARQSS